MFAFLSSRLRTWLLLAIAVPVVRRVLQTLADRRARSHPDSRSTTLLRKGDTTLARLQSRRGSKQRRR